MYLAVFTSPILIENCLTTKENPVAWQELDEYENKQNNKTECRIFPYKRVPFKKYSCLDS